MIYFFLLLLPLYGFAATSWENAKNSEFHVKVDLSSDKITLKDRLTIELSVTYPKGYLLDTNATRAHLMRQSGFEETPFKIVQETVYPPVGLNDQTAQQRLVYELEPIMTGVHYLSFFDLPFHSDQKKTVLSFTYIFPVTVAQGDEDELAVMRSPLMNFDLTLPINMSPENRRNLIENPSKTLLEMARNQRRIEEKSIPWLAILGAILMSVFMALTFKKEKKSEVASEKLLKTLKEKSLDEINHIRKDDSQTFFVELTDVIRHYIEKKYEIHATSQTTEEFLHNIQKQRVFSETEKQLLEEFLTHADAVKFAKYAPSEIEKDKALAAAKSFIASS